MIPQIFLQILSTDCLSICNFITYFRLELCINVLVTLSMVLGILAVIFGLGGFFIRFFITLSVFSTIFTHRKIVFHQKNASCRLTLNIFSKLPYRLVIVFLEENTSFRPILNIFWKMSYRFIHVSATFDVRVIREFSMFIGSIVHCY